MQLSTVKYSYELWKGTQSSSDVHQGEASNRIEAIEAITINAMSTFPFGYRYRWIRLDGQRISIDQILREYQANQKSKEPEKA